METANTQFHLSLSLPLATLKGSKNGNCKHAISFLSLSLSLSLCLSFATLNVPTIETANTQFSPLFLSQLSLSHLLHSKLPTMQIANTQFQNMRKHGGGYSVFVT